MQVGMSDAGVGGVRVKVIFEPAVGSDERLLTGLAEKVAVFAVCCANNCEVLGEEVSDDEFIAQL